jgi:DNA-binding response OmpR family regulator
MNIILLEPDKLLGEIYTAALTAAGHSIRPVVSAQAAVHMADTDMPDLVISELQLPRHNGVEFLYEFRSYAEWLHIPVIVQTFVPQHELQRAAILSRELGVVRTLYKPETTLQQLVAVVRKVATVRT